MLFFCLSCTNVCIAMFKNPLPSMTSISSSPTNSKVKFLYISLSLSSYNLSNYLLSRHTIQVTSITYSTNNFWSAIRTNTNKLMQTGWNVLTLLIRQILLSRDQRAFRLNGWGATRIQGIIFSRWGQWELIFRLRLNFLINPSIWFIGLSGLEFENINTKKFDHKGSLLEASYKYNNS